MNHITAHFRKGVDIRSWRLPFGKNKAPRDHRSSIDYQKRNDDDDDEDDGGDGHNPFGGGGRSHIPGVFCDSSGSSGSSQTSSSGYDSRGWRSFADGSIFKLATGRCDSNLKVENYLKHQLVTDQPGEVNVDSRLDECCYSDSGMEPSGTPLASPCTEEHAMILNDADEDEQGPTKKVVAEGIQDQVALEKISVGLQTSKRTRLCQASEWESWEMLLWNMPLNFALAKFIWHCSAADEKRRSKRLYKTCKTLAGILATNTPIGHALGFAIVERLRLSGVILSKDLYAFVCLLHHKVDLRGFRGGSHVRWMNILSSLPSQRIKAAEEFWRVDFNFVPKSVVEGSGRSPSTISRFESNFLLNSRSYLMSMGTLGTYLRQDRLLQHKAYQAGTMSSFSSLDSYLDIDSSRSTFRPIIDIFADLLHPSRSFSCLAYHFIHNIRLDNILYYPYRASLEDVPNADCQHIYCHNCAQNCHTQCAVHCPHVKSILGHLPKEECYPPCSRQFIHWNCCSPWPFETCWQDHLKGRPFFHYIESLMTHLGECSHDASRIVQEASRTRRQVAELGRGVKGGSDASDKHGNVTPQKIQCWFITIDRKEGLFRVHLFYPCGACCVSRMAEIVSAREEVETLGNFLMQNSRGWSYGN